MLGEILEIFTVERCERNVGNDATRRDPRIVLWPRAATHRRTRRDLFPRLPLLPAGLPVASSIAGSGRKRVLLRLARWRRADLRCFHIISPDASLMHLMKRTLGWFRGG